MRIVFCRRPAQCLLPARVLLFEHRLTRAAAASRQCDAAKGGRGIGPDITRKTEEQPSRWVKSPLLTCSLRFLPSRLSPKVRAESFSPHGGSSSSRRAPSRRYLLPVTTCGNASCPCA
jgi:hypothetical protein